MPASSSSSTSCQRLAWREPGALVWASSSTSIRAGRRASAASRSNSRERGAAVLHRPAGQDLQVSEERFGLRAPVGIDPADDHVHALGPLLAGGLEHRVGLADPRGGAEEDLELAACLAGFRLLDTGQQLVGIRATLGAHQSARRQPTTEEPRDSTTAPSRYPRLIKKTSKSSGGLPRSCGKRGLAPPAGRVPRRSECVAGRPRLDAFLMRRGPVLRCSVAYDR